MRRKKTAKKVVVRTDTSTKAKKVAKKKEVVVKAVKTGVGTLEGIAYESHSEKIVLTYFLELKKYGYVLDIQRSPSFLLADAITHNYVRQLKRSSRPETQTIVRGHSYTADYVIYFSEKAIGVFCWLMGSSDSYNRKFVVAQRNEAGQIVSHLEVKPDFDFQGNTAKATNDCKWVWQKYGIFIMIYKPGERFKYTWAPKEYIYNLKGEARKLKFTPKSLQEYLNSLTI